MSKYRNNLPQTSNELFITDGGLETTMIFDKGYDLPEFAAFDLLSQPGGYEALRDYYLPYIGLAKKNEVGFILESATWRASRSWGRKIGYDSQDLKKANQASIALLEELRSQFDSEKTKLVISGCIGPRGDGYAVDEKMTAAEAKQYHQEQINVLGETGVDVVSAFTMNYAEEAVGITRAAQTARLPVVISFTVETDGKLPSGQPLGEAIAVVDRETGKAPAYYMINCAHPTHFRDALKDNESWLERISGIRANASAKSHAELDEAEDLDVGNPADLGALYQELRSQLSHLNIFGGCCGTDHRHLEEICKAVVSPGTSL
jgi:S-methylmethionine-dependent homocysteine/selenocysteine methylase